MKAIDAFYHARDMLEVIGFFVGLLFLTELLRPKSKNERTLMQIQTTLWLFADISAFIGLGFVLATFILK